MLSKTESINIAFAPLYYLFDKQRTKSIRATPQRIQESYQRRSTQNDKPNFLEKRSLSEILGTIFGSGGLIGLIVSCFKENKILTWISSLITLGSLGALITGVVKERSINASTRSNANYKVKINKDQFKEVECEGSIPVEMWDPNVHGKGIFFFRPNEFPHKSLSAKLKKPQQFKKVVKDMKDSIHDYNENVIMVEKFPYYSYRAKYNGGEIEVLIPKIYQEKRPDSVKRILEALEDGLSAIPQDNLLNFYKKIRLHIGGHVAGPYYMSTNRTDECAVEIYHGKFDPSKDPNSTERAKEDHIVRMVTPDKRKIAANTRGLVTDNGLYHELGHLILFKLDENKTELTIPSNIFPQGSPLQKRRLQINKYFALYNWNNNKDSWAQIVKADGNQTSSYGNSPCEDFCEAMNGYMNAWISNDLDHFKSLFPHRYAALKHIISLTN